MQKGQVDIFIPCTLDQLFPHIGWDVVAVLEHLGYQVRYNPNQTCCGAPSFYHGLKETTREIATKFLEDFNVNTPVVCPGTQCSVMVERHYDQFFRNTSNHNIYRGLQNRLMEFTALMCKDLEEKEPVKTLDQRVFFWGSCSGQNDCGLDDAPIKLLRKSGVKVLNERPLPICCGNIGAISSLHEDLSVEHLAKSLEDVLAYEPELIVFDEPNCLLQVSGYFKKQGIEMETKHIAQVLKELYVS